jgi:hypothetical protein
LILEVFSRNMPIGYTPFMKRRIISAILLLLTVQAVGGASGGKVEFDTQLANAAASLNREFASGSGGFPLLSEVLQLTYGAREDELRWAADESLSWGEIAVLAYIQATTGRSFEEMVQDNAQRDFWSYAEAAGMNGEKMARALSAFVKLVEKERNSRIFEKLRASRRVHALPDLGSGFGLFQEALDFRRIDSPGPVKIHLDSGARAKVE